MYTIIKHNIKGSYIMDPKGINLGRSLLIPSVQELAKESLTEVPHRYIRANQDASVVSSLPQVPIINMENLSSTDSKDYELEKLHLACKDWGFFQLINHGVSCSLLEKVKQETQEFFNMPMEEKKKYWQQAGDVEGFGQAFVVSDEQKLDWADIFFLITLPTDLRKPHLLPNLPLPFRDTIEEYSMEVKKAAFKTLVFIAKALNMEVEEMKVLFKDGMQSMRMNYYPPCPQPNQVIGLTPHSDAVGITFLLQLNQVEGLQIKKDGQWIPVKPLDDAFIVNIGDVLQMVTNGAYKSIEHRAIVNSEKKRLSIATFLSPNMDGDFGPAPSLITPETPARFTSVTLVDFLKNLFSRELKGKTIIDDYRI
ncbi:protein SRG1-like [Cynara cardunculus var. scolymus]|uniref:Non-heme dioxygenase N-terminal domain-containing protein n=1 Tax=Cynara cardunculus var. scolymus TaxID=59895 RepID=A0A118K1N5_CYNCS|nr:protein SRG1-like [Cynara cardunculus var. scolymus]KVI03152.1 Non-heme dioxygenase N-terminal domain-containing protein [Cynara cardunculus var. scolymus]